MRRDFDFICKREEPLTGESAALGLSVTLDVAYDAGNESDKDC
jgi:hypothetical protein